MDLIGPLYFYLATPPKLLISGVNLKIKLEKRNSEFTLLSANDHYKFEIQHDSPFIRSPSIVLAHEKNTRIRSIKISYPNSRSAHVCVTIRIKIRIHTKCFYWSVPARLILGLVSNEAYNGKINKNPFKFNHYNLNYLCILKGGIMIPAKPLTPDFQTKLYARSYLFLFADLGRYHASQNLNIDYSEYEGGHTLFAFDLTPDFAHVSISKNEICLSI